MTRHEFRNGDLTLSYLDAGGNGEILIALHAHWMEGATFLGLAEALAPGWRVIALDQRGHGHSSHAVSYTREDYLDDLAVFYRHLRLNQPVVLLGNSLGGVNAYQFAARHPELVRALIIEDIGVEINDDTSFALPWGGTFSTREELEQRIGPRFVPFLEPSFRQTPEGWKLAFDPRDTIASQGFLNGNHWNDWLRSKCPALIIRGQDSRVTRHAHLEEMAARRPNTQLRALPGGHVVHLDSPALFSDAVREFLETI